MSSHGGRLERIVRGYVRLSERRGGLLLLAIGLLIAVAATQFPRLRVDDRVQSLLPPDTPSQRALETLQRRAASTPPLYLLIESSDVALNRRLAAELAARVGAWPETEWVITARDPQFFLDRRLLYLTAADLEELAERVDEILRWEECERLPGCENLDERPSEPTEEELWERYERIPEVAALRTVLGASAGRPSGEETGARGPDAARGGAESPTGGRRLGDLCSDDGRICAVQAAMRGDPTNLDFASRILAKAERLLAERRPSSAPADLKLAVSGQYLNAPKTRETVARDLAWTTFLSLGFVMLSLLAQFRGFRAFIILAAPLTVGAAWSQGLIGWLHPSMNLITAFTMAVLGSIGIDYGIHMLSHYGTARARGLSPEDALVESTLHLASSISTAAFTAGAGFGALAVAEFAGFSEMGLLASLSIATYVVATFLVFPPFVLVLGRLWRERGSVLRELRLPGWLQGVPRPGAARYVVLAGLLCALGFGYVGAQASFEYDLRKIKSAEVGHGIAWGRAMHGTQRTSVALLGETAEALEAAVRDLRTSGALDTPDRPVILSGRTFVPEDQPARLRTISRLRALVEDAERRGNERLRARVAPWRHLLAVDAPITPSTLPRWVHHVFSEKDGAFGTLAVLYSDLSGSDARQMETLSARLAAWRTRYPRVEFASSLALLGEVVPGLRADTPVVIGLALLGLVLGTLVVGRSVRKTALVVLNLAAATAIYMGLAVLFGWKINLYNLVVFPLAFGAGVDGSIFVMWAIGSAPRERWGEIMEPTSRGIIGAAVTTIVGYGALVVSSNLGLQSVGYFAMLALTVQMFTNLLWLPSVLALPGELGRATPANRA